MDEGLKKRIEEMIGSGKVFLFMKGTPDAPKCGFSFRVVSILQDLDIDFQSFDVLTDFEVREGIKEFSDWPTIPQLYIDGQFVGGCEIAEELYRNGELKQLLEN